MRYFIPGYFYKYKQWWQISLSLLVHFFENGPCLYEPLKSSISLPNAPLCSGHFDMKYYLDLNVISIKMYSY